MASEGAVLQVRQQYIISRVAKASAAIGFALSFVSASAQAADQLALSDLKALSIDELSQIEITSVSKTPQRLGEAPAAIYVITQKDIKGSGATTIPEILRLAPNLHVAQQSASKYVIAARGFSGSSGAQNL